MLHAYLEARWFRYYLQVCFSEVCPYEVTAALLIDNAKPAQFPLLTKVSSRIYRKLHIRDCEVWKGVKVFSTRIIGRGKW